jgi:TonB family protein
MIFNVKVPATMNGRPVGFVFSSMLLHGAVFSALASTPTAVEPSPVSRAIEFITITDEGGGRLGNDTSIGDAKSTPEEPPEQLFRKVRPKPRRPRPVAVAKPKVDAPSKPVEPADGGDASEDGVENSGDTIRHAMATGSAGTDPNATRSGVGSGGEGVDRRSALRAWLSEVQREVNKMATRNYPSSAVRMRLEGRLRLGVTIGVDGRILAVRVLSSSGHPVLDQSATASVTSLHIPAPPKELGWRAREISLPVRYALR